MKTFKQFIEAPRIPRKKGQPAGSDKHSDLYTDENPKGTIHGLGFKDEKTARASVKKIEGSGKTHAHKIQAAIANSQLKKLDRFEGRNYFRQFVKVNVDQIHHDAQIYMPNKNMISEEPWDYEKWYKNDMKNFFLDEFDLNGVK